MTDTPTDDEQVDRLQTKLQRARDQVHRRIVGQETVLDQVLACVLADGNALLEGTPGLGKTLLVRTIADVTDLEFSRIQNTPDLMPSDVTGTEIVRENGGSREFVFERGPVFANVVLADEINRATPKTQAALLEAMQEKQVTVAGETYDLPEPFFLLATQNPIEQEGSLHPDESLYMDGRLWTASEALDYAQSNGDLVHDGHTRVYDVDATTQTMTPEGELVESDCMVYESDFDGEMYTFETKTGRRIRVTHNHPFLVNRNGVVQWRQAQHLGPGDALVSPRELSLSTKSLPGHDAALDALESKGYDVVRTERVGQLTERLEAGESLSTDQLDALRIAADYSKKDLADRIEPTYNQVCNFFQGVENDIGDEIAAELRRADVRVGDHVEDYTRHRIDDELTEAEAGFFVGFVLAEGSVEDSHLAVTQKNLATKLDRWIDIAERIGLEVSVRSEPTGRKVQISSKPFVEYLDERFSLRTPERLLSAPEAFRRAFLEIFLLTESHYDADRRRITFTQKDQTLTNLVAHFLLCEGIVPWLYDEGDTFRLKIQGEDVERYLELFEWRGERPNVEAVDSVHRTVPLPRDAVARIVEYLGMKHDEPLSDRSWYNSYNALQSERNRIPVDAFDSMLADIERTLERRREADIEREIEADIGRVARHCGLSMTDIVEETQLTKHRVWQSYQSGDRPEQATEYVAEEYESRIETAGVLAEYLREIRYGELFHDRITSVESEPYSGPVIGLSVPEHHNYLGGLGACGISHNTYPLPEAQADRFLMKITVDPPDREAEREIVDRYTGRLEDLIPVEKTITAGELRMIQELVRQVPMAEDLRDQAIDLVRSTREAEQLEYGASPRASMALVVTAKARAFMRGRTHVEPEDVTAMARPVLRHRVIVDFRAEREGVTPDDAIAELL